MSAGVDTIHIALGAVPEADAFGLDVGIGGAQALETIRADAPGVLRWLEFPLAPDARIARGWLLGFLQRGPLRMPVLMPCDGWVLASAPDGARVGHGAPLFRILRFMEGVVA